MGKKNLIPRPSYVIRCLLCNGDMPFLHQSSDGFGNGFLTRDVRRSGQGVHSNTTDVLVVPIGQPKQAVIDRLLSGGLQTREEIAHIIRDFIIVRFETL